MAKAALDRESIFIHSALILNQVALVDIRPGVSRVQRAVSEKCDGGVPEADGIHAVEAARDTFFVGAAVRVSGLAEVVGGDLLVAVAEQQISRGPVHLQVAERAGELVETVEG